ANTGGGGGGTDPESSLAGNGGSGIVIIKYLSSTPLLQGGTVTTSNGYQIHTFTATGSQTVAVEAACGAWRYYRYYVPVASANPQHLCINEMQYLYGGSVLSTPATHCGSAPCAFATSGIYSDWSPEKAFDQSNYAMYGSGYCNEAGDGYPRGAGWLAYDFGVPTQVDQVSDSDDEDVKMSAFNTDPISSLTLCYKTLDNCYTYELGATYTSASALFSSGFIRSENLGYGAGAADAAKQAWTDLFLPPGTPTWYDDYWNGNGGGNCNMQRPGINTQCNDNNWARIGYCVNLPDQSCQPYDTSDADSPIGIGLKTQNWPNNVNAPFGEYFIHGAGSSGVQLFQHQAWLFAAAFTMQLYTLPKEGNGRQFALKCIKFEKATRTDIAKEVFVSGTALTPHWGNSPDKKTPLKLFHYMMDRGHVYGKGKRQAGCRYIEKYGPRANNKNQFVEWTDEMIHDENSPMFGWMASDVKESLRNYAPGTVGARTLGRWAVTLKRFDPSLFDRIVVPILRSHDVHGTMWIGKTRVGKSTASKTIGFVISAYQIEKHRRADLRPSGIAAKKIDFLRLEPGAIIKPAIADDTALAKWGPDEIKAFLDPAEEDAPLWARWGGASFGQNQSRQICVNPYNEEFGATVKSVSRVKEEVAFSDLIKNIDCNFIGEKQCCYKMADVEAYVAGSNVVLLSPNWVHFRAASTTKEPAPRFPWPVPAKSDLSTPGTYDIVKAFKKDQTRVPSDYDQPTRRAAAAMKKLARGEELGQSSTVRGPTPFDQDAPARYNFPEVATQPPSGRQGGEWFPRAAAGQPTSASCPVVEDTRDIDEQLNACRAVQQSLCDRAVAFHGRVIDVSSPQPLKRGVKRLACPDVSTMDEEERESAMQATKENIIERGREAHGSSIDLLSPARPPAADVSSQDIAAAMAEGAAAASGALHFDRAEPRAATATDAAATWEKQAAQSTLTVEYLIVGGGGGGASGGGGGGGVLQGTGLVISVDEVITVGAGGLGGSGGSGTTAEATNGGDSSIGSLVAYGGGKGAGGSSRTASSGGSGGGGAYDLPSVAYAAGVAGQGYRGGRSDRGGYGAGGGGGGAGGVGSDAPQQHYGGDGGVGVASSISGTSTYYGGGGGGGVNANCGCTTYPGGAGGLGGGGDGSSYGGGGGAYFNGEDGQANTGGGGGGTDPESSLAGNGGSGIVIIRYLSSTPLLQGGTVTTSNGYQIHTFTATGSQTVAVEAACGAWRYYRYYVPVASANPQHLCINEMQYLYGGSVLSTPATHCGSAPCAFATSGFYSDWSPEKAFDQSNYAMYGSGYCNEAGDGYPRGAGWLAYDFGVPTQVDQVKIWFWRGDHSASGTAYMEGSNDAVTWTTLKTITDTGYATLDTTVDCVASPSSAPTLLMKLRAGSNTFQYDASYWTDTSVLNEAGGASVSDSDDEDVKMSAFNTDPISALTLCYKTLDNCYTYELGATYTSASALFSSGFIRSENLGYGAGAADAAKQAWTDLFLPPGTPTWYDDYWNGNGGGNCNMQRPGINTQCNDNNWARIGYCVNLPDQSCQPYDTSDADSPIGIGLKTQNWPNNVNAPFGEYFIHGAGSSGVQLFQHQ
ncbi:unnamed protein product, partial [Prorocentrum cordatum]